MVLQVLGMVIATLVAAQAALALFASYRQHRGTQAILKRVTVDARARARDARERDERRQMQSDLSWTGYRKFVVRKRVIEDPAQQVCSFYLEPHDRRPLPPFNPGQFLTFQLDIRVDPSACLKCGGYLAPEAKFCTNCGLPVASAKPAPKAAGKPTVRCYSLSDGPHPERYRVSIKRVPPPRDRTDLPPGLASNHFHNSVKEGDILDVMAPGGKFYLDLNSDRPVVLIGGGVGVTPVLSMLNAITDSGSQRETWFFYGLRNGTEHVQKAHLERLAHDHPNVKLHVCYSAPRAEAVDPRAATLVEGRDASLLGGEMDKKGRDFQHAERVTVDLLKRVLPSSNYAYYICGPQPMMNAIVEDLEAWGVPTADIHYEAFGPATVKKTTKATTVLTKQMQAATTVKFAKSGTDCVWSPDVESILDLAEANGVPMDSGCRVGNCNTCLTAIKEGDVEYLRDPDTPPEKGSCLTCIAVPKGNLVLDA